MGRTQRAPASRHPRRQSDTILRLFPLLAFLAASSLLYGNTLLNGFVHDDKPIVAENRLIRDAGNLSRILGSGYWTTREASVPELYRPLTILSFAINRLVLGAGPAGFHLVNILLHGIVCWLVFRLALDLGAGRWLAWAAGLLFAAHPVHVEAVAPIVGRSELMAGGFALAALIFHRRGRARSEGVLQFIWAALLLLAACLSKESAIAVGALALLTDLFLPAARRTWTQRLFPYFLYAGVVTIYLAARVGVLGAVAASIIHPLDNPLVAMDRMTAWRTAIAAAGHCALLLIWPARLSADYAGLRVPPVSSWLDPSLLAGYLVVIAIPLLAVSAWRRGRLAAYGILFHFLAWLPISNLFFFIGTLMAERLLYLPSAGFCLAAAALLAAARGRLRNLATGLLAVLLLLGSARTMARNRVWHDDGSFAFATATDAPTSAKAQFNLGVFLEEHGDPRSAAAAYGRAAQLAPAWADAQFNRAGALAKSGEAAEAVAAYRRALELQPGDPRFVLNLGYALYQARRHGEAVQLYRDYLASHGDTAGVLNSLGANLMALGKMADAIAAYRKAVTLAPEEAGYRLNLARALEEAGQRESAVAEYRAVLQHDAHQPAALRGLGMLAYADGDKAAALDWLNQARAASPRGLDPEAESAWRQLSGHSP